MRLSAVGAPTWEYPLLLVCHTPSDCGQPGAVCSLLAWRCTVRYLASFFGLLPLRVTPTWRAGSVDGVTGEGGLEPALSQHQTGGACPRVGHPAVWPSLEGFFGLVLPTVCPWDESSWVMSSMVIAIAANEHPMAVCHRKKA